MGEKSLARVSSAFEKDVDNKDPYFAPKQGLGEDKLREYGVVREYNGKPWYTMVSSTSQDMIWFEYVMHANMCGDGMHGCCVCAMQCQMMSDRTSSFLHYNEIISSSPSLPFD